MPHGGNQDERSTSGVRAEGCRLILLFTNDAPRSRRARNHLAEAIGRLDLRSVSLEEVDLIENPGVAVRYRVFATPALVWECGGQVQRVLYGDLSDWDALEVFLSN